MLRVLLYLACQQGHDESLFNAYVAAANRIALYSLSESDAKLLLDATQSPWLVRVAPSDFELEAALSDAPPSPDAAVDDTAVESLITQLVDSVASRLEPRDYFFLDGLSGVLLCPFERLPSSKAGVTVAVWVRPVSFRTVDTGLLSIETPTGDRVLDVSFRLVGTERCVAVQSHDPPNLADEFVFDAVPLSRATSAWHLIVYTHRRQTATVYIDGALVQTSGTFNYPRLQYKEKDKGLVAVVGRRGASMNTLTPSLRTATMSTTGSASSIGGAASPPFGTLKEAEAGERFWGYAGPLLVTEGVVDGAFIEKVRWWLE